MNGLVLFARLRHWRTNVSVALCSGAGIVAAGPLHYSLKPDDGYLIAVIAQLPLIAAVSVQASSTSGRYGAERHAHRPLLALRLLHYTAVSGVVCAILAGFAAVGMVSGTVDAASQPAIVVRNFCALVGAAFLGGRVLGARFGWVVAAAWAIVPYILLTRTSQRHEILTLVVQPPESWVATVVAGVVWATGLVVAATGRTTRSG